MTKKFTTEESRIELRNRAAKMFATCDALYAESQDEVYNKRPILSKVSGISEESQKLEALDEWLTKMDEAMRNYHIGHRGDGPTTKMISNGSSGPGESAIFELVDYPKDGEEFPVKMHDLFLIKDNVERRYVYRCIVIDLIEGDQIQIKATPLGFDEIIPPIGKEDEIFIYGNSMGGAVEPKIEVLNKPKVKAKSKPKTTRKKAAPKKKVKK